MTPENHEQEFTCADCAHFNEVRSLCRLVNKLRPPRRTRCKEFALEPLARLGGGTGHYRPEDDDTGFGAYARTREDQG
jgi:hypothetical protein